MIMVSIGTFSWRSIKDIRRHPWQSSLVMVATVVIVVWTGNLAAGVVTGVVLSGLFFASKVKRMFIVTSALSDDERTRTYKISGEIFFASAERFAEAFDFKEVLDRVVIDLSDAHFWDITGVGTLDKAVIRFRRAGTEVEVVGLNEPSAAMVERFAVHDKPNAEKLLASH
jgi:SulP family sulfate permease